MANNILKYQGYEIGKSLQEDNCHQIIEGIRKVTNKPIECHIYTRTCDKLFIDKLSEVGTNMLILPAEHFIGAPLAARLVIAPHEP